ncbi:MAG: hypothetical protein K2G84_09315, partial [Muribaculaceae bacterium]|nr:hypothetical protein [Muribaculaceae bacterium]
EYVDASPSASRLVYDVDAEYSSGLISPYSTVTLRIPMNKVVSVTPEMTDAGVGLWWTLDTRLSRMDENAGGSYQVVEHNCSEVEFAHRFSADDLIAYNGYKIRRIGFMAYQPSSEAEYTIQVWKGAKGSLTPTLVSQRVVKEFGAGIWNRVLLTSSATMSMGYDYWIGGKITAKNGVGQMVADNGDLVDGYGNLVRVDGGEWHADSKASGNYYLECELATTADDAVSPVGTFDSFDPETDLYYPIGFVVTRDGEPIATTSSRYFLDASPLSGTHTYGIASLYKGGSESTPLEVTVTTSSLESVAGEAAPEIIRTAGGITVTGFHGAVSVYDISGRAMFTSAAYRGEEIPLSPGVYVVRAGTSVAKTHVR